LYLDIANIYGGPSGLIRPELKPERNEEGMLIIENPNAPVSDQKYSLYYNDPETSGTALPTIGLIVDF